MILILVACGKFIVLRNDELIYQNSSSCHPNLQRKKLDIFFIMECFIFEKILDLVETSNTMVKFFLSLRGLTREGRVE